MKNIIIVGIGILLFSVSTQAQFYDFDSEWHTEYQGSGFIDDGYAKTTLLSDTTINGQLANRIEWSSKYWVQTGPSPWEGYKTNLEPFDTLITYTSGDDVFVYREGAFHLAFRTSATTGDIWDLGPFAAYTGMSGIDDDHAYLKVTNAFATVINGELIQAFDVVPSDVDGNELDVFNSDSSDVLVYYGGTIYNRFGPTIGFYHMGTAYSNSEVSEVYPVATLCYSSGLMGDVDLNQDKDCENDLGAVGLNEQETIDYSIYPNPSSTRLTVDYGDMDVMGAFISDLRGSKVLDITLNYGKSNVDVSQLKKGVYILSIIDSSRKKHNERFVIE
jgi:hypothetical protein